MEREKALLNELRSHDFFFIDGDGSGDDEDDVPAAAGPKTVVTCDGEDDEAELTLVSCEAIDDTESLDRWRPIPAAALLLLLPPPPPIPFPFSDSCRMAHDSRPASNPCLRNWSMNLRSSCSSFSYERHSELSNNYRQGLIVLAIIETLINNKSYD